MRSRVRGAVAAGVLLAVGLGAGWATTTEDGGTPPPVTLGALETAPAAPADLAAALAGLGADAAAARLLLDTEGVRLAAARTAAANVCVVADVSGAARSGACGVRVDAERPAAALPLGTAQGLVVVGIAADGVTRVDAAGAAGALCTAVAARNAFTCEAPGARPDDVVAWRATLADGAIVAFSAAPIAVAHARVEPEAASLPAVPLAQGAEPGRPRLMEAPPVLPTAMGTRCDDVELGTLAILVGIVAQSVGCDLARKVVRDGLPATLDPTGQTRGQRGWDCTFGSTSAGPDRLDCASGEERVGARYLRVGMVGLGDERWRKLAEQAGLSVVWIPQGRHLRLRAVRALGGGCRGYEASFDDPTSIRLLTLRGLDRRSCKVTTLPTRAPDGTALVAGLPAREWRLVARGRLVAWDDGDLRYELLGDHADRSLAPVLAWAQRVPVPPDAPVGCDPLTFGALLDFPMVRAQGVPCAMTPEVLQIALRQLAAGRADRTGAWRCTPGTGFYFVHCTSATGIVEAALDGRIARTSSNPVWAEIAAAVGIDVLRPAEARGLGLVSGELLPAPCDGYEARFARGDRSFTLRGFDTATCPSAEPDRAPNSYGRALTSGGQPTRRYVLDGRAQLASRRWLVIWDHGTTRWELETHGLGLNDLSWMLLGPGLAAVVRPERTARPYEWPSGETTIWLPGLPSESPDLALASARRIMGHAGLFTRTRVVPRGIASLPVATPRVLELSLAPGDETRSRWYAAVLTDAVRDALAQSVLPPLAGVRIRLANRASFTRLPDRAGPAQIVDRVALRDELRRRLETQGATVRDVETVPTARGAAHVTVVARTTGAGALRSEVEAAEAALRGWRDELLLLLEVVDAGGRRVGLYGRGDPVGRVLDGADVDRLFTFTRGRLVQLSTTDLRPLGKGLQVGLGAWPVATSQDARLLLAVEAQNRPDRLSIVDLATSRRVRVVDVPLPRRMAIVGAAWLAPRRVVLLYDRRARRDSGAANPARTELVVVDPIAGRVVARRRLPVRPQRLPLATAGGFLLVGHGSGAATTVELIGADGAAHGTLGVPAPVEPFQAQASPDGRRVAFAPIRGPLVVVDVAHRSVALGPRPDLIARTPTDATFPPAQLAWADAGRVVLTGVAARAPSGDGVDNEIGAWIVDAATLTATRADAGGMAPMRLTDGVVLLRFADRLHVEQSAWQTKGHRIGLVAIDRDGGVLWRRYPGASMPYVFADPAGTRLFVIGGPGHGQILEAHTGQTIGNWKRWWPRHWPVQAFDPVALAGS